MKMVNDDQLIEGKRYKYQYTSGDICDHILIFNRIDYRLNSLIFKTEREFRTSYICQKMLGIIK